MRAEVGAEVSVSYLIPPSNETGTSPVTKTALSFEVNRLDAMTVSPPWVNAHYSTSPGTPLSALPGSSYPKAVKAKAAASSLSGGNFIVVVVVVVFVVVIVAVVVIIVVVVVVVVVNGKPPF